MGRGEPGAAGRAGGEPAAFMAAMERQTPAPAPRGRKKPRVIGLFSENGVRLKTSLFFITSSPFFPVLSSAMP